MEPLKAQGGRAFQLTTEESKVAPDVVASTFLFSVSIIVFLLCVWVVPVIRYVFSKFFACFSFI